MNLREELSITNLAGQAPPSRRAPMPVRRKSVCVSSLPLPSSTHSVCCVVGRCWFVLALVWLVGWLAINFSEHNSSGYFRKLTAAYPTTLDLSPVMSPLVLYCSRVACLASKPLAAVIDAAIGP
jgi:hypothetical protein